MSGAAGAPEQAKIRKIYGLFFISGISGLIYQVVWVRQFAYIFGNSVYSAAVITAIFMAGLGLGGWAAGGYIDRRFGAHPTLPLRAYGYFEGLIGVAGLFTALILPNLGSLSAAASSYVLLSNGWHAVSLQSNLLRYLVPILLLTPVTALMGATLTLLIRFVVAYDVSQAGFRIGMLYGLNTAGAAVGCLATDLFLVPQVGLFATQCVASLGNLAAAFGALHLARQLAPQTSLLPTPEAAAVTDSPPLTQAVLGACCAAALSGAVGMGMEIVWFRYLISMLGGYREVFSLLLGIILVGMWLGSTVAGMLHRRFGHPIALYAGAQAVLVTATILPLMWMTRSGLQSWIATAWHKIVHAPPWFQAVAEIGIIEIIPAAVVAAIPALMMGATFPLANAAAQDEVSTVGRRAGLLYAANTLGAVAGAIVAGFWLLPHWGAQLSVLFLLCCSVLSLLPLALALKPVQRWDRLSLTLCAAFASIMVGIWLQKPSDWLLKQSIPPNFAGERVLTASEGIGETIVITQGRDVTRLITNGHSMSNTALMAQRYMRLFAHLPLLSSEQASDVLIICYGVGNTLNATLMHPQVQHVDLVDISEHVLRQSSYFSDTNGLPLADPRVDVFINDGRQHLRIAHEGQYDLITAEPPPISHAGVAALYSSEFYQLVRSRLKPGGVMTHWLPIEEVGGPAGLAAVRSFLDVFPNAVLLSGSGDQLILLGVNGPEPFQLDVARMQRALSANPQVAHDLTRLGAGTLLELAGLFVASSQTLANATRDVLPVTDDYPILEYNSDRPLRGCEPIAGELFRPLNDFTSWCPHCSDSAFASELDDLPTYLDTLSKFYASPAFLAKRGTLQLRANARTKRVIMDSFYLRRLFTAGNAKSED